MTAMFETFAEAPERRRRRGRTALVAVAIVVALLVGLDRVAVWVASRVVTGAITSAAADEGAHLDGASLTIHGFPFLTQVAGGQLNQVTATLDAGDFGGFRVADVQIDVRGVSPRDPHLAESAQVRLLVPFGSFESLIADQVGANVQISGGDQPGTATIATTLFGLNVGGVVTPLVIGPSTIGLTIESFTLAGLTVRANSLPFGIGDLFTNLTIPLDFPDGLYVVTVNATENGLSLAAEGHRIELLNLFG